MIKKSSGSEDVEGQGFFVSKKHSVVIGKPTVKGSHPKSSLLEPKPGH